MTKKLFITPLFEAAASKFYSIAFGNLHIDMVLTDGINLKCIS